ncbi:MAG: hypothetical protein R3346_00165 [Candidatus Spechtbacterales bacterium]|nr:hypothetical protein [Candidatus Spechtbacterales bacterium]
MGKIKNIKARKILNSKGRWTVETRIETEEGFAGVASVPQGESRGGTEAVYVTANQAVKNIHEIILPTLKGDDTTNQESLDNKLLNLDGTTNKSKLGANAILSVSLASAKVAAVENNKQLWQYLGELYEKNYQPSFPRFFMNFIEGGAHAGNGLYFQEYLVIPKTNNPEESIDIGIKLRDTLKNSLEKEYGKNSLNVGDEGGFAPNMHKSTEPFEFILNTARDLSIDDAFEFGIDAAANSVEISPDNLFDEYVEMTKKYPMLYIEDPFTENDFENFTKLNQALGSDILVTGDDLTTTNLKRIKKSKESNSINSIIIKPNQIGSLSETLDAIRVAREYGWKVIVSHRGGETNDDFISDLAYAVGAFGIKLGGLARGERIAKYNRFLQIATSV